MQAMTAQIKPTKIQEDIDLTVIDDDEIWRDYKTTTDMLTDVGKVFKLPCDPMIKVLEDGLIVGVLTKTNQFVTFSSSFFLLIKTYLLY